MANSRETAWRVLVACHTQGAWADAALKQELSRAALAPRDAALASHLTYGVLQNRRLLDHYLSGLCTRPLRQMDQGVLELLRLGAYQLLFLDKIPTRAAVDETVKLAKRHTKNPKTAGFVNGVLSSLDRTRDALPPLPEDPLERLSVQYSHPMWLVQEFVQAIGMEETQALLAAHNATAPVTAQVNRCKITADALCERLAAEGVEAAPHPWMADCLILTHTGDLQALPAFREGLFYIQDPAAKLAVLAAKPCAGERVLDLCAAPGGKSFAAAVAMGDDGTVLSRDLYPRKVQELSRAARRLGLSSIQAEVGDATAPVDGLWDLVIADVPCSGLGIIRKKPDIRDKDPATFADLIPLQAAILKTAARAVRPGGRLLYATCTLRRVENEEQVERFLGKEKDFTLESMDTLWPHRQGTDGFFYAVLRREVAR